MAGNVQKTIDIIFAGVDNVSGVVKKIGGSVEDVGANMADISAPFDKAVSSVVALNLAIAGIVVAGAVAAGGLEKEMKRAVAAVGLPAEEAAKFEKIALDAYKTGAIADLETAFTAAAIAQQKFGASADVDLNKVIAGAQKINSIWGVDYADTMGAAKSLMNNFGIDVNTAMDFVAKGFQTGLDGSGDFLQSLTEYGVQFSEAGADVGQFFSVLETGYQEGYLGADKAADAFKEFRVRIQDGSKTTREALQSIGIDPEAFEKNMASGRISASQAFDVIVKKLNATKDTQVQFNAGVGLMGTTFEDSGKKIILSLDQSKTKIGELQGTLDDINVDSFEKDMVAAWRTAVVALLKHPAWKELREGLADRAGVISQNFVEVFKTYDFTEIIDQFKGLWDQIAELFVKSGFDFSNIDGMILAFDTARQSLESLVGVTTGMIEVFGPIVATFVDLIKWFNSLDANTKELAGNIAAIGSALGVAAGVVSAGGALISGLGGLLAILTGPVGLTVAIAAVSLAFIEMVSDFEPMPDSFFTKPRDLLNEFKEDIELFPEEIKSKLTLAISDGASTQEVMKIIDEGLAATDQHFNVLFGEEGLDELKTDIDTIPDEKKTTVTIDGNTVALDALEAELNKFEKDTEGNPVEIPVGIDDQGVEDDLVEVIKTVEYTVAGQKFTMEVPVMVPAGSITKATETIEYWLNGVKHEIEVPVDVNDNGSIDKTKAELDGLPKEKKISIELQGEIDKEIERIKASAETIQTAMEWTAKIDIAEAQAQAAIIKGAYESISTTISSTGDVISTSIEALAGLDTATEGASKKWAIEKELDREHELREKAFDLQKELTDAQIKNMEAKTKAIEKGDAAITIDSTGLEPALEMIMWQIIEKVQVKANEQASDFLLGV